MKGITKGALVLGVVLLATFATLIIMQASAAINGDVAQLRDRDQTHTRTRLQIQDFKLAL